VPLVSSVLSFDLPLLPSTTKSAEKGARPSVLGPSPRRASLAAMPLSREAEWCSPSRARASVFFAVQVPSFSPRPRNLLGRERTPLVARFPHIQTRTGLCTNRLWAGSQEQQTGRLPSGTHFDVFGDAPQGKVHVLWRYWRRKVFVPAKDI